MIYLSSFLLSTKKVTNPNLYPYNVFAGKDMEPFVFAPVTILYGNNGSGKSTILNIIAQKLNVEGCERYAYGQGYIDRFVQECTFDFGDDEEGRPCRIPRESRYIKSEDILFEIKKIQQEEALERGYIYEAMRQGRTREQAGAGYRERIGLNTRKDILQFAQEKYSNGETAMQMLMNALLPDCLYLLDEPEVSLSPQNQMKLAEEINQLARFCNNQFIIATHSPFLLGTIHGKIYNLDEAEMRECKWTELPNVRFFHDFFKKHEREFG